MRLFPYPSAAYNEQLNSRSYNIGNSKSLSIIANIKWYTYSIAGVMLGNSVPNFGVVVDMNSAQTNTVKLGWQCNSIYIDNTGNNFPVYVQFPDTNYTVPCQPNTSGWFPVITSARTAQVFALGMTTNDITALASTLIFFSDETRIPYLDPEQQTALEYGIASPTIAFGSGGSGISSVVPLPGGSGYNNGNLTVSGAGGTGAVLTGTIDNYGRFTSVAVNQPGSGYIGAPVITPTGGQTAPAAFNAATLYVQGVLCQYGGKIYICYAPFGSGASLGAPPGNPNWGDPNLTVNAAANFSIAMTAASGGLLSTQQSNFGPRALGDQIKNYIDDITAAAVFRSNLFGSPYNSGNIIITSLHVQQITGGPAGGSNLWQMEDGSGNVVFTMRNSSNEPMLDLSNCNIRLPATANWRFRCTSFSPGAFTVAHGFTYTYNPNY